MNAVGIHTDLVTFFHESGHALHSFATADERIMTYKEEPSEVAELASMSMEFMSMDYWDQFYTDDEDLKKAKSRITSYNVCYTKLLRLYDYGKGVQDPAKLE